MNDKIVIRKDLKSLLDSPEIQSRFNNVLGRNSGAFIAAILNASVVNPEIRECEPMSVITSALQAAIMDLSISAALGQAAIIPFNSKSGKKASLQIMKNGLIQLALRTDKYRHIHVANIYEGETWIEDRFTGKMTMGGKKTSSITIGKVAYFALLTGFEKYMAMSIEEILEHARKYSKSWDTSRGQFYPGSAWDKNFDKMCEKTVLKLLIKNYGILSDKMQQAFESENETGEIVVNPEVVEGEVTEPTGQTPPPEEERTQEQMMSELGFDPDPIPVEHDAPVPPAPPYTFDPDVKVVTKMQLETAEGILTKNGKRFESLTNSQLEWTFRGCNESLKNPKWNEEKRAELELKRDAAATVYVSRQATAA